MIPILYLQLPCKQAFDKPRLERSLRLTDSLPQEES
jgi:hypothetical protein